MSRSPVDETRRDLDIEKLARTNQQVDMEKVEKAREYVRMLRNCGVPDRGHTLAPPFRREVHVQSKHSKLPGGPLKRSLK